MKIIFSLSIVLLLSVTSTAQVTVNAAQFGLKQGEDNTPALLKAIEECKRKHATRLILPKGRYDLFPEKALERYREIPNNDNGKKRIVFLLEQFKKFEIDGQGSELICHDHMLPFDLHKSENITIKNLSINWSMPFYFQGKVVALHPEDNSFDLQVMSECQYEIQGNELIFSNKKTEHTKGWYSMAPPAQKDVIWEQNIYWNIWFDPKTKAPAYNAENSKTRLNAWNFQLNVPATTVELSKNLLRIKNASNQLPQVGWVLVINGIKTKNRLSPAINIANCKNIVIENVTVHHSSGIALIVHHTENISLNHYCVLLPSNSERLVTTTADASHFVSCKGLIKIENCIMENMLDDATNIHGVYCNIDSVVDDFTVGMIRGHSEQQGFEFAKEGDKIQLVDTKTLRPYEELNVVSIHNVNEYYFEVRFNKKIRQVIHSESSAYNLSWQPDVEIRNCIVRQNRSRGFLISTAGNVLIENNKFIRSTYAGVMIAGDANYWYESGPVKNVVIRNNLFDNLGVGPGFAPVLLVAPEIEADSQWFYHNNIVFEGNTIITFARRLVELTSVQNFQFKNNTILKSEDYPVVTNITAPAFVLKGCKQIRIENNKYKWGGVASIQLDTLSSDVISNENENIESIQR